MITPPNPWRFAASDYKKGPCPVCGARSERTAESKCKPTQDQSGEYYCPGSDTSVDEDGNFLWVSQKAINRANLEWEKWECSDEGQQWIARGGWPGALQEAAPE